MVADYPFGLSDNYGISDYATTSSEESVYIIGGYICDSSCYHTSIIAEYKNDQWNDVGRLKQARGWHNAITMNPYTMVIGGGSADSGP